MKKNGSLSVSEGNCIGLGMFPILDIPVSLMAATPWFSRKILY